MQEGKEVNIILRLNHVQKGMNFAVPLDWWTQFVAKNENIRQPHQIKFPSSGPYETLIEIGVLQPHFSSIEEQLATIIDISQNTTNTINQDLKHVRDILKIQLGSKRAYDEIGWWTNSIVQEQGRFDKLLISPQFHSQIMIQMGLQNIEWKLVSPFLYKAISEHYSIGSGMVEQNNIIFGLPVFLSQINELIENYSYYIGQQFSAQIYLYGVQHQTYCVIGYLENNLKYCELLRYLHEGMRSLTGGDVSCCFYRQGLVSLKKTLYFKCPIKQDYQRYLNWIPFSQIAQNKPRINKTMQLIEYSSCRAQQEANQQGSKGKKLIKVNQAIFKKKEFQPPILPSNGGMPIHEKINKFQKFKSNHPQVIQQHLRPQDKADSTQGDTPDQVMQEILLEQYKKTSAISQSSRIEHKLWAGCNNVAAFRTLSELKMSSYIPKPNMERRQWHFKDKQGQKWFLEKNSNQLKINQLGELQEVEDVEEINEEEINQLSVDIINGLQRMARSITGERQVQKIEGKDKSQNESQTCKNQIDQQDSELSRQQ